MNTAGFYRRPLSDRLVAFASPRGRELFREALEQGGMDGYFSLAEQFHTQVEPAFCGLGTLVVVLNALSIDPGRLWKGPWRWYSEELLDCCQPLEVVKEKGITLGQFSCLARCNGAKVVRRWAEQTDLETFRLELKRATSSPTGPHLVINYSRKLLDQTGDGHFSPIGGYHEALDMALVLDVARFKYPPHWVPVPMLWQAMQAPDPMTKRSRGYLLLSQGQVPAATFCQVSCERSSWGEIIRQLEVVLPEFLDEARPGTVNEALEVFFQHLTPELMQAVTTLSGHLQGSIAQEHEQAIEDLLTELRATTLYGAVVGVLQRTARERVPLQTWMSDQLLAAELATILLLTSPDALFQRLPDPVRAAFSETRQLDTLSPAVQAEVMKVRSQFQAMRDYCCGRD